MTRPTRPVLVLALAALLAACQAAPGLAPEAARGDKADAPRPRASKAPVAASAAPSAPASAAAPSAATPLEPAATLLEPAATLLKPAATLLKPAGAFRTLAGTVRIDAAYAVAAAGAGLVSNNGGTAVMAPGQLVSNDAGNLIANNAGNLIANNAGNLIANNGGALVGNNGGTLVGNNGGTIVANHAGGLTGKTKYHLAQAGAGPTTEAPAVGTILPAAGMVVTARSLRTGAPVALGVDGDGKPVTAILTNAAGGFELYVPDGDDRLVFEARFPGEAAADRRLRYDLLPASQAAPLAIDEDTAQVTRYVRDACQGTVVKFVLTDDVDETVADIAAQAAAPLVAPLTALVKEFRGVATEVGLDGAPAADVDRVAARMTDVILAHVDLGAVNLTQAYWPDWKGPEEPAIPALTDVMRRAREASTTKLAAAPTFFDAQPYLLAANQERAPGKPPFAIRKPADLNELVVQGYVVPDKHHAQTEAIFTSIGVEVYQSERMYAAVNNYIGVIAMTLFADVDGAKTEAMAVLRSYAPGQPLQ